MNREFNLRIDAKMGSGFILDILCIPVDSPLVSLHSIRCEYFHDIIPGIYRTLNSTRGLNINRMKSICWIMQVI